MSESLRERSVSSAERSRIEDQLAEVASRREFTREAVVSMWHSIIRGGGAMAQFSHAEFGGHGQWMRNGMIMVGDMFNHALAAKVSGLCEDLAQLYLRVPKELAEVRGSEASASGDRPWWPDGLGGPSSSGAQNGVRYAFFPAAKRLVIERAGRREMYDTDNHIIGGVAQQQGATNDLKFSSQLGNVDLHILKRVEDTPRADPADENTASKPSFPPSNLASEEGKAKSSAAQPHEQVLDTLERLAALHGKGILTDGEYSAKKAELLARL